MKSPCKVLFNTVDGGVRIVEFRILGPLQVVDDDGAVISIPQRLIRRAICLLVLHADRALPRAELMELLSPDAQSDGALRTCRYTIRRLIGDHRLVREGDASRLRLLAGDRTDLSAFREAAAAGRAAASRGESDAAAKLLASAVDLWRDPRLPDLPDNIAAQAVREQVTAEYRATRELLVQALYDCGRYRQSVELLQALTADEPLNEAAWHQLMLALYRSGRKAEALLAYQRACEVLAEEASTAPSSQLRQLARRIRDEDPGLRPAAVDAGAVTGRQERPLPPLRQLPPDLPDFTGRAEERQQLIDILTTHPASRSTTPIAVIAGPAGHGKSALAVRVGHEVAATFPDGQCFLQLAGSSRNRREPGAALREVLHALGVGPSLPSTLSELTALYRSELAGRRMLVVLDDAGSYGQVVPLLPGAPGSAVIITSRIQSVSPLGGLVIQLAPFTDPESLQLLRQIVDEQRIKAEPEAAEEIVRGCGGSPLALRIAGARLAARPNWPLAYLADRLRDPSRRLDELSLGDLAVRKSIDTAYQLLPAQAQVAFRRLAMIGPHDVASWVIAVLAGEAQLASPAIGQVVEQLVDTSMLQPAGVDVTGEPRYRLHDLMRDYAAERLADDAGSDGAFEALLAAMLELTELAGSNVPDDPHFPSSMTRHERTVLGPEIAERLVTPHPRAWLHGERRLILSLIATACARGHTRLAAAISMRMDAYLHLNGYVDDAEAIWRTIVTAAEAGGERRLVQTARSRLASLLGAVRSRPHEALPMLDRCVEFFESPSGSSAELARALYVRAYCYQMQGRLDDSRTDANRALRFGQEHNHSDLQALALRILGLVASKEGRHEEAIDHCLHATALTRELDPQTYRAITLYTLILVMSTAGQHTQVLPLCAEGIALTERIGHGLGLGYFHLQAGHTLTTLGRHHDALPHLEQAVDRIESHGASPQALARARFDLGRGYQAVGDPEAARPHLELCLEEFRLLGLTGDLARVAAALEDDAAGTTNTSSPDRSQIMSAANATSSIIEFDPTFPSPARMYDYWLGGKDNFAVDRELGDKIVQAKPGALEDIKSNRAFLKRAVRHVVRAGIRQLIDIGSGLPTAENTHEIAQRIASDARVIYVDNDPMAVSHGRALLANPASTSTAMLHADLRQPDTILGDPQVLRLIDLEEPMALLLLGVADFIADGEVYDTLAHLVSAIPRGSYLIVSHLTGDDDPKQTEYAHDMVADDPGGTPTYPRTRAQISRFFNGLTILDPGIVAPDRWRPDSETRHAKRFWLWAGVGIKE